MKNTFEAQIIPANEKERLAKLYSCNIIKIYEQSGTFKHIARMVAHIFKVQIAIVNFVDEKSVITEASVGTESGVRVPREISLCSLAILQDEVTVFENAKEEPCLLSNPMVHGDFGLQFYAGAPLITADGFKIGVIAIVDKTPRKFSKDEEQILKDLAAIVMEELEEVLCEYSG